MKKVALRALQSLGLLAIIWVIAWRFIGPNAAVGVVVLFVIVGIVGTLITLD